MGSLRSQNTVKGVESCQMHAYFRPESQHHDVAGRLLTQVAADVKLLQAC
jgi:hypothetical protein